MCRWVRRPVPDINATFLPVKIKYPKLSISGQELKRTLICKDRFCWMIFVRPRESSLGTGVTAVVELHISGCVILPQTLAIFGGCFNWILPAGARLSLKL